MEAQTGVFILCCNRLLRESVTRIVSKRTSFHVTASQSSGTVSADEIIESKADVVICDSLPFILETTRSILRDQGAQQPVKSILVAMDDNPENFLMAVRHGVLGYVLQEASAAEVLSAIRCVAEGEAVCPPRFAKVLFEYIASQPVELNASAAGARPRLTRREQQLIPLVCRGLTNKEIANHLNVSEQTIKSHVHRILRKAGVGDRQSLSQMRYDRDSDSSTAFQS
jgi:DNA-binding NarL/FixJ family response regulator